MPTHFEVIEDDCIGCALCIERAPENLEIVRDESIAHIIAQPSNDEEVLACMEAAEYCPMGALSVRSSKS
jgi:ferredoxin